MRHGFWILLVAVLAGCAQAPAPSGTGVNEDADPRARIHTELAAQYYTRAQYAIALDELRIALEANSSFVPAYNMLGLVHNELKEYPQAEQHFRRAVALAPQYSEARNNFGFFLCQRGRYEEAMAQFEAALMNPLYTSPDKALANAGVCSLGQGKLEQAEGYLQRALVRAPTQAAALQAMADVHYRRARHQEARAMLARLAEVSELNAAALWLGVRVERQLGDRMAEAAYGTQLRRRFPDASETRQLMSGNYEGTKQ